MCDNNNNKCQARSSEQMSNESQKVQEAPPIPATTTTSSPAPMRKRTNVETNKPQSSKQPLQNQKRKREQSKSSSLDDYDEGAFWERVINNPDSEWPIVKQLLEHLNAQWRVHKQGAAVIVSKFKASKNKDDGTIDEQQQGELLNMLRQAGKEKERLAAIGSRGEQEGSPASLSKMRERQGKRAMVTESKMIDDDKPNQASKPDE
ncbi:hypothetical protein Q1695_007104 [Nippostrongylus brasiliensis]|nr:hypothetical protein Q1695_007104 [Nippostrongylus brasiliensis]